MKLEVDVCLDAAPGLRGEPVDQQYHVQVAVVSGHLYRPSEYHKYCFAFGFQILGKFAHNMQPCREGNSGNDFLAYVN